VGGSSFVGKYEGLDKAVEEVLAKSNSLDNLSLTAESQGQPVWKNLEKACLEIARQAGG
jgi:DNA/RNA endonuclease G (NUC1)